MASLTTIGDANTDIVFTDFASNASSIVGNYNFRTETKIVLSIDNNELFFTNDNQVVTGDIDIDEDCINSLPKSII